MGSQNPRFISKIETGIRDSLRVALHRVQQQFDTDEALKQFSGQNALNKHSNGFMLALNWQKKYSIMHWNKQIIREIVGKFINWASLGCLHDENLPTVNGALMQSIDS